MKSQNEIINSDNKKFKSNVMYSIMLIVLRLQRLSKKDSDVLCAILAISLEYDDLIVDAKQIAEHLLMPVTNVYRHIKHLENREVIIKNDNGKYSLNIHIVKNANPNL